MKSYLDKKYKEGKEIVLTTRNDFMRIYNHKKGKNRMDVELLFFLIKNKVKNLESVLTTNYIKYGDGRLEVYGSTATGNVLFPVQFRDVGYNRKLSPIYTGATYIAVASTIQGSQTVSDFQYKVMYWDENTGAWILDINKSPMYYHVSCFWR